MDCTVIEPVFDFPSESLDVWVPFCFLLLQFFFQFLDFRFNGCNVSNVCVQQFRLILGEFILFQQGVPLFLHFFQLVFLLFDLCLEFFDDILVYLEECLQSIQVL